MTLQQIFNYARDNNITVSDALLMQLLASPTSAGVGVGGVNTKGYKIYLENAISGELLNVLSFSVENGGTTDGYFTHDAADGVPNRQIIKTGESFNFGGAINFFSYLRFYSPATTAKLTITYILKA